MVVVVVRVVVRERVVLDGSSVVVDGWSGMMIGGPTAGGVVTGAAGISCLSGTGGSVGRPTKITTARIVVVMVPIHNKITPRRR